MDFLYLQKAHEKKAHEKKASREISREGGKEKEGEKDCIKDEPRSLPTLSIDCIESIVSWIHEPHTC